MWILHPRYANIAARYGVYATILYLVLALGLLVSKNYYVHGLLLAYGVLATFTYSVSIAYVASFARKTSIFQVIAIPLLVAMGFLVLVDIALVRYTLLSLSIILLLGALHIWRIVYRRSTKHRYSLVAPILAYIASIVFLSCYTIVGREASFIREGLGILLSVPIPMIYAVTWHSLPTTYGDKPELWRIVLQHIIHYTVIISYSIGVVYWEAALAISFLLYIFTAKIYKLNSYYKVAMSRKDPARRAHLYYVYGHLLVLLIIPFAILASIIVENIVVLLHVAAIGFIGLHIYTHTPLMIPTILSRPASRRFSIATYILLLASLLAWQVARSLSLPLIAISLAALLYSTIKLAPRKTS